MNKSLELLISMREIYGQPPLSELAMRAYFEALAGVPDEQLAQILGWCLRTKRRIPLPCEVLQSIPAPAADQKAA